MAEFAAAGLSSTRNDEPTKASRPFDRERDTGALAEGGGAVVLETLDSARARGAHIYLEILGYHAEMDANEFSPCEGLASTMRQALENAACSRSTIDYISAWGCGHPTLDLMEVAAIKEVFRERAYHLAVGSIKGVIGNPGAAAGPLQVVALAMSYQFGLLPPLANYTHQDILCDLDYPSGQPRRARLRHALVNSHGLGGGNGTLVVSGPPAEAGT